MNQKLIWNFELAPANCAFLSQCAAQVKEDITWEARFFWPEHQVIILRCIDSKLSNLTDYKSKIKSDCYYLLPHSNHNIKLRRNELFYKPILEQTPYATGFGKKLSLTHARTQIEHFLLNQTQQSAKPINISKETFTYTFETMPKIKLELARLTAAGSIYFSACIQGHSRELVQLISKSLLEDEYSCDYVTFLKQLESTK